MYFGLVSLFISTAVMQAGRSKEESKNICGLYSALRPCSGPPLTSLSPGTAVVEPRQNLYCWPQGYVLINMFFKGGKKPSKPEHTSHGPQKNQNGSTKKNSHSSSVIPDTLGSQCHHEELKINIISHIILEAEANNIIISWSYIVRQWSKCLSVALLSNLLFISPRTIFSPTSSTSNQIGKC